MRLAVVLGAIVSAGACTSAMAQGIPQVGGGRQLSFGVSATASHDTNSGQVNGSLASRTVQPADDTFRPHADFTFVQPIGRQAVFLEGTAGYNFHKENKQLNHVNADMTGGGIVTTGICRTTLYGTYAASQSDPGDAAGLSANNLLTNTTEGLSLGCGTPTGITGQVSYRHSAADNSNPANAVSNHAVNEVTGSIGYGTPSLGSLSVVAAHSKQDFPNQVLFGGTPNGGGYTNESIGLSYQKAFGQKIRASISAGGSRVRRDAAPVGIPATSTGLNYSGTLEYKIGNRITLSGVASRAYLPSDRAGKLYELMTRTSLSGSYHLNSRLDFVLGVDASQSEANADTSIPTKVPTSSRKTAIFGNATYHQGLHTSLSLSVRHSSKTTDLPDFDYSNTNVSLTVSTSF